MENCFEKHKVKLDPNSETSTVFRPIDKYANRLPHLIGSDKWNEKWHVGLLDKDSSTEKRPESSMTSNPPKHEEEISARRDSMESIAKSVSSIGDSLIINQKPGSYEPSLVDHDEVEENVRKDPLMPSSSSSMFRPQQDQRRIVNLFDDEPPSINSSPGVGRKPVNLFDDYGSVDSFPSDTSADDKVKGQTSVEPTPPVDLFNDNEFENFIEKMEKSDEKPKIVKRFISGAGDMKAITDEIKKVQLKKSSVDSTSTVKKSTEIKSVPIDFKQMLSKTLEKQVVNSDVKSKPNKEEVKTAPLPIVEQKMTTKKTAANLFDDDDDVEIVKKIEPVKSTEKPREAQKKTKITNLFDDEDDDDPFEKIFEKKKSSNDPNTKSVSKKLFDEDEKMTEKMPSKSKSLFDDKVAEINKKSVTSSATKEVLKVSSSIVESVEKIEKVEKVLEKDSASAQETSQSKSSVDEVKVEEKSAVFNVPSIPFVDDEPPDDDTWETESNNFDDADNRGTNFNKPKISNFSSVPLFDEVPPEDDFMPSKPPIPEPNFYSEDDEPPKVEISKPKDESDNVSVSAGIRGKLDDLFKKKQEKDLKDSPPKKIPGKLSSDLKINVGALMPGMRPPSMRKSTEDESEKKDDEQEKITKSPPSPPKPREKEIVKEIKTSNDDNLSLLNNDLAKSRAKIQVKRRPSTRKARQESYQKTMSAYIAEESKDEESMTSTRRMSASFVENVTKSVEVKKVLSSSIFGDDSEEEILEKVTKSSVESKSSRTTVTNKIPVFYDDEEDTKKLLEQKKNDKQKSSSLFADDESDDELFGKRPTAATATKTQPAKTTKSLFGEDDDDENLFASKSTKKLSTTAASQSSKSKLFESDEDEPAKTVSDALSSKPKTELPKKKSLFGDDDDDDDDLFSSKPKCKMNFPSVNFFAQPFLFSFQHPPRNQRQSNQHHHQQSLKNLPAKLLKIL